MSQPLAIIKKNRKQRGRFRPLPDTVTGPDKKKKKKIGRKMGENEVILLVGKIQQSVIEKVTKCDMRSEPRSRLKNNLTTFLGQQLLFL